MKRNSVAFLLFLAVRMVFAYSDPEIEILLSSLSNLYRPSLEDYLRIEHYFQYGERPYLETIKKCAHVGPADVEYRIQQLRNFKLVGPNGEMPIMELHPINVNKETKNRCILIYASYNQFYAKKARMLLEELKECGYSGFVMLRIGGFPNISNEGVRLCTIPFTFRIAFFREAVHMGFTHVLYLDANMHPLTDLSAVFDAMDEYGYYSSYTGSGWLTLDCFRPHAEFYNIPVEERADVYFIQGYVTGLNFMNPITCQLFEAWGQLMESIDGFCSIGDDHHFSELVWRFKLPLPFSFTDTVYVTDLPPVPNSLPSSYLFYMDQHRLSMRQGWAPLYDY